MDIIGPKDIYTESYIGFKVNSEEEGKNLISYLKCKLPNIMLSIRKITHHINSSAVKWIPIVPLDRSWDDKSVYEYFGITEEDI